jgi:signal transduction histidine kinase
VRTRLFLQIYLGFVAIALVFSLAWVAAHWLSAGERVAPPFVKAFIGRFAEELPAADLPRAVLQERLDALADEYAVDITVWAGTGELTAWAGRRLEGGAPTPPSGETVRFGRHGVSLSLPDGRRVGIRPRMQHRPRGGPIVPLLLMNAVIALVAWPVSRRMARRLERLRIAVDELGSGDLSARVPVEGRDEIADVARSFNRAAERIEGLVGAQRRVLASASHELRSPLARLRMAVELLSGGVRTELRDDAERDIEELDALIGDVLAAARLEAGQAPRGGEALALLDLVRVEAGRVGATVEGEPVTLHAEPRMLRSLLRNLLENAARHGGGPVDVAVGPLPTGEGARIRVDDRGPGIPERERERIFEPFYRPEGHSEGRDGGVGLGLALVREIARHHGGDAHCFAREGGGTRFEVDLRGFPDAD